MANTLTAKGVARMLKWAFAEACSDPENEMFDLADTFREAVHRVDNAVEDGRELSRTEMRFMDFVDDVADELNDLACVLDEEAS